MFVDGSIDATNVNFASCTEKKTEIARVEIQQILPGIVELPSSRWRYTEGPSREHNGPMAEDIQSVFGL